MDSLARKFWEAPTQLRDGYLRPAVKETVKEPVMVPEIRTVNGQTRIIRWVRLNDFET